LPELTLEFEFDHPGERVFELLRGAENHERFMPLCQESRVSAVNPEGTEYLVDYVLASRKYGLKREAAVRFEVDPVRRRIVARPAPGSVERVSGACRIEIKDRPDGGSRAEVRVDYEATGAMRLVPLSPILRRMFQRIMRSVEKRADKTGAKPARDRPRAAEPPV